MNCVLLASGNTRSDKLPLQSALLLAIQKLRGSGQNSTSLSRHRNETLFLKYLSRLLKVKINPCMTTPAFGIVWLTQAYTSHIWALPLQMLYSVKSRGEIVTVNLVSVMLCFHMQQSGQCFLLSENIWVELPTRSRSARVGARRIRTLLFSHPAGCV